MPDIRILHLGLGPIGAAVARVAAARKGIRIVGAVDIAPDKAGRDLGDVIDLGRRLRVKVAGDLRAALRAARPQVVVACTSSSLKNARADFETILRAKASIVSTTEELAYPWWSNRRIARELDALARRHKAALLGTGVNPGFVMDALPIALTGVCESVDAIRVDRVQDASIRRLPFQKKIGAGQTREEFERMVAAGTVRHVGLTESIAMIADALGWKLDQITDTISPKMADRDVATEYLRVPAGRVAGIVQDGVGYRAGKPIIELHMEAYIGAPESYDSVRIDGRPPIVSRVAGGFHGDVATAAVVVNSISRVAAAAPGLHSMRDLPLPGYSGGPTR